MGRGAWFAGGARRGAEKVFALVGFHDEDDIAAPNFRVDDLGVMGILAEEEGAADAGVAGESDDEGGEGLVEAVEAEVARIFGDVGAGLEGGEDVEGDEPGLGIDGVAVGGGKGDGLTPGKFDGEFAVGEDLADGADGVGGQGEDFGGAVVGDVEGEAVEEGVDPEDAGFAVFLDGKAAVGLGGADDEA